MIESRMICDSSIFHYSYMKNEVNTEVDDLKDWYEISVKPRFIIFQKIKEKPEANFNLHACSVECARAIIDAEVRKQIKLEDTEVQSPRAEAL